MKIKNSHFVITGGSRGIGYAVAQKAAVEGAHIYIGARSFNTKQVNELLGLGAASVHFIECDLATRAGVDLLLSSLEKVDVDIVFNNAGMLTGGLIENQELDDIYSMFQVNVNALVHITRGLLPGMLKRKNGKIVNNASVSAIMHFPGASTYAASKAAVLAFSNCLSQELLGTGVTTLTLITPGVKTTMFDQIEVLYGKNLETPKETIGADEFADQVIKSIQNDDEMLLPKGATYWGLLISKFTPWLFKSAVRKKFKRT